MPHSRDRLPRRAGRTLTVHATVGTPTQPGEVRVETLIAPQPDGAHACVIALGPHANVQPDGDAPIQGRFFIVPDGSLTDPARFAVHVLLIQFPPEARLSA